MSYENLTLTVADSIATLTLNRPAVLNALNPELLRDLRHALDSVAANREARVLVMTGAGKGFCAGADLAAAAGRKPDPQYQTLGDSVAASMYEWHNRVIQKLWDMPKPVVSSINGVAAGGGVGLALTADIVVAAKSASFVCVFAPKLGIAPDMGATFHLQRLVGRSRALGMAMLGDKVSAEQALDWGMIYQVVDDTELQAATGRIAARLAASPPLVFPRIRQGFAHAETATMAEQLAWEAEAQRFLCATQDFQEGVAAFVQKRPPVFQGK
ncbi:MAG TPA: enoyl-CoA hydratase-related protein [Nevskiaceae bacterium]|nr:enoyl-CoA hydratase-related protein [Nevskiaceae bacterium]